MKIQFTKRDRNIVWNNLVRVGVFTRRVVLCAGPLRMDVTLL